MNKSEPLMSSIIISRPKSWWSPEPEPSNSAATGGRMWHHTVRVETFSVASTLSTKAFILLTHQNHTTERMHSFSSDISLCALISWIHWVADSNFKKQSLSFQIWCWSHHSGCALFKTASLPLLPEDQDQNSFTEKSESAVAFNYCYIECYILT